MKKIFLCFLMSGFSLIYADSEQEIYKNLNVQAVVLNDLINQSISKKSLSIEEQGAYVKAVMEFVTEVEAISLLGGDVVTLKKNYLQTYYQWAEKIISDKSLLEKLNIHAQTIDPDSSKKDSIPQNQRENIEYSGSLYEQFNEECQQAQDQFILDMQSGIQSFGSYDSKSSISNFKTLQNQSYQVLYGAIQSLQTSTISNYVSFLKKEDSNFDPATLSPEAISFINSIDDLGANVLLASKACMIDLTSKTVKAHMIQDLNMAFNDTHDQLMQAYQKSLEDNLKDANIDWWHKLRESGIDLLQEFGRQFSGEFGKLVSKAIVKHGKEIAGDIGGAIAGQITDIISPALKKKIEGLSSGLRKEKSLAFLTDASAAARLLKKTIRLTNPEIAPSAPVKVQVGNALSLKEKTFVANRRKKHVQTALKDLGIDKPLTVAFCCSGGGVRALVGTLAIFSAAAKAGILQTCMYTAGLSGSTWLIAPWVYAGINNKEKDLNKSLEFVKTSMRVALSNSASKETVPNSGIYTPAFLTGYSATTFSYQIAQRLAYEEPISAVDLYGAMVANFALNFLNDQKLTATWSALGKKNLDAYPLPLCSAVFDTGTPTAARTGVAKQYEWFEMNPDEAGSDVLGYIPVKRFGSVFEKGVLDTTGINLKPEYPLSFYLGVYGSAFSLSSNDVIDKALPNPLFKVSNIDVTVPVDEWIKTALDEQISAGARDRRVEYMYTKIANFSWRMPSSALANKKEITLVDAGINFNFPLPLLFNRPRNVDVVIIYDSNPGDATQFVEAAKYFERKKIAIPNVSKVSKNALQDNPMTVFNDPRSAKYNEKLATFIYFPTMVSVSKSPYITSNFKYSIEEFDALFDLVGKNFDSQVDEVKKIMQLVAEKRLA